MLQKLFISLIFILGLTASAISAQNTDQAVMRVSAHVVSGVSIDGGSVSQVTLSRNGVSNLGTLSIRGMEEEQAHVSVSETLVLQGTGAEVIELNITSRVKNESKYKTDVVFEGLPAKTMVSGAYRGELSTTIEYF